MNDQIKRAPLTSDERKQFEAYMATIFGRLGMDLTTESCKLITVARSVAVFEK